MEYKVQIVALNRLLADTHEKLEQIKALASSLKEVDETSHLNRLPDTASGLKTVLQEAKAASEVYGPDSPESVAAWNEVDFCSAVVWQVHAPAGAERFVKVPGFICIKFTGPGLQSTPRILNGVQTHLKTLNNFLRHLPSPYTASAVSGRQLWRLEIV